ncbi:MAG: hypothetical protein AB1567_05585 [bacterium]
MTIHDFDKIALTGGNVGIGTTEPQTKLDVNGEIRGKLRYTAEEYVWKQGWSPVKMIHKDKGFCFLTYVSGKFEGDGECVKIYIDEDDGYWYLGGTSQQAGVDAHARGVGIVE